MDFYEKEYKDMVQRARELHESGNALTRLQMEIVCPALAESEDERIRKELISFVNKYYGEETKKEVIAYLEKQKDKRELDFAEGKVEGARQICQEIKDAMSLFEPKDLTPFEFTFRDYIDSAIRYCLAGEGYQQYIKEWAADLLNLEKQKEQEPINSEKPKEWSGEDEKYLNLAINIVASDLGEDSPTVSWLKSLRPQPKQEWSEEDEKNLKQCIEIIGGWEIDYDNANPHYSTWLKSLRPQPHWKPSEEQMRCLLDCVSKAKEIHNASVGGYDAYRILVSLYDELHKLL